MEKLNRCGWCEGDELYEAYHDNEWGVPVYDDDTIFEFLILETFQAGLSWITVLRKRENFREAFDNFDYKKIANYSEEKIQELLQNPGIIRNKLKVRATVTNAKAFMEVQKEFSSFSKYIWDFVDGDPIQNEVEDYKNAPATTAISDKLSKDLKKKGFKFVGSTVLYAHMQATGMVNDHEISCFRHSEVKDLEK
ncbi:DNA-3-methyladenine glycosylase I [Salegentibacter salarius]|uniref:DNA-3-methyladenine glycosylase I n=1 Tax=Salegentibacter salarius TaxID=435906 RepID=A0A2N0TYZ6_9FLAO|nr:DNA-3-methyladenine glycosylase I [Salegentibacter salarius]OEY73050.1 DNA-3-methyladenine glycosylase [Salegentibacter salarius]PKD19949.1 DNA-3-methyladenine glycosylase [Salegentibacter salarius]SLJ87449.1 DNA-3-methyladenine glycosylase I [Salegentibacter salarius]